MPALDGLRGAAVLMVLAAHALTPYWEITAGQAGVMLFFALSGFLITLLLLDGQDARTFYQNRALRLLPAVIVFVCLIGLLQSATLGIPMVESWPVLLYVANWYEVPHWFSHCWSLAVEEQFYIVWPLALSVVRRWRNGPLFLCAGGLVASAAIRVPLWDGGDGAVRIYLGTDTEAFALLCGSLLAVLMRHHPLRLHRSCMFPALAVVATCSVLAATPTSRLIVPILVPLAAVVLLRLAVGTTAGWLCSPFMRYVGSRSYGLYLWHPVGLLFGMWFVDSSGIVEVVVGLALSFAAAEASWRVVERPFLCMKSTTPLGVMASPSRVPRRVRAQGRAARGHPDGSASLTAPQNIEVRPTCRS